jgi:hypothetical protein
LKNNVFLTHRHGQAFTGLQLSNSSRPILNPTTKYGCQGQKLCSAVLYLSTEFWVGTEILPPAPIHEGSRPDPETTVFAHFSRDKLRPSHRPFRFSTTRRLDLLPNSSISSLAARSAPCVLVPPSGMAYDRHGDVRPAGHPRCDGADPPLPPSLAPSYPPSPSLLPPCGLESRPLLGLPLARRERLLRSAPVPCSGSLSHACVPVEAPSASD